jgi:hypothetical protein
VKRAQSPLGALARGMLAGLAGTAALSAYQAASARKKPPADARQPASWEEAPAPAQVGYRFLEGMFRRDVSPSRSGTMANIVHWLYGTAWGGVYGLFEGTAEVNPLAAGTAFGSVVFANAYVALPAMGIYDEPWEHDPKTLAKDWSYHLVYGLTAAAAFRALEPR